MSLRGTLGVDRRRVSTAPLGASWAGRWIAQTVKVGRDLRGHGREWKVMLLLPLKWVVEPKLEGSWGKGGVGNICPLKSTAKWGTDHGPRVMMLISQPETAAKQW